jgi:hypothetical protein
MTYRDGTGSSAYARHEQTINLYTRLRRAAAPDNATRSQQIIRLCVVPTTKIASLITDQNGGTVGGPRLVGSHAQ